MRWLRYLANPDRLGIRHDSAPSRSASANTPRFVACRPTKAGVGWSCCCQAVAVWTLAISRLLWREPCNAPAHGKREEDSL